MSLPDVSGSACRAEARSGSRQAARTRSPRPASALTRPKPSPRFAPVTRIVVLSLLFDAPRSAMEDLREPFADQVGQRADAVEALALVEGERAAVEGGGAGPEIARPARFMRHP